MTFTVTYRGAEGALREEVVEAAGRGECFAQMRARGIVPVSVKEGARKGRRQDGVSPHGRNEMRPSRSSGGKPQSSILNLKSSIFLAAVLAVAGGTWWWLAAREDARPSEPKAANVVKDVKDIKDVKDVRAVKAPTNAPTVKPQAPDPAEPAPPMHMGRRIVGISATTNADGTVVERIRTDDGKLHSKVYSVAEPVLTTRTDQLLAMAVDGNGDGPPMPAVTKDDEKRFLESLKRPIEILDTDTPDVRALKEKVMQAREDMVTLLSQGRGFAEVLAEHGKMQAENAAVRRDVAKELRSIMESGDTAGALEYRKRMNVALEQMGIAPLTTAITEEERAERAERRRASRKERRGQ